MKKRKTFILLFLFYIISIQCLPDRMPPAPIENQRPEFVSFSPEDSAAIAVPLRKSVTMIFNEPMMVSSFSENFTLQGIHGEISGTFSANDSLVTFTPGEDMMIASVYTATVSGGVRDKNGNSLTLDEDWQVSTWFFTEGQYSHDGFPYVFIADRSFDILYQVGNFEELLAQSTEVIQPRGMAFSPDGQILFVVSKQAAGQVAVIDPVNFSKIQDISVGVGPEEIAVTQDKIFVVNVSARTISVLALSGFALLHTIEFTDGFRPRDIAHHPLRNIIYVSSNDLTKPGILKIIDAENYQEINTITNVVSGKRSEKMLVSDNSQWLVIQQEKSDFIRIMDASTDQIVDSIIIPFPQNKDMDILNNKLYVCSSGGYLFKYDLSGRVLEDSLSFNSGCDGVAIAPLGEIIYVSTSLDSLVYAVDDETLHKLRSIKVSNTISKIVISPNNY